MTRQQHRFLTGPLIPIILFVMAFLISLAAFIVFNPGKDGRVFYYPDNSGIRIGTERRGIPQRHDIESQIAVFLKELVLGPVNLELTHTVPSGTDIRHVAVVGKTVYVDLDRRMLKTEMELPISFNQALENVRYNILFNFSRVEEVTFTVEGQQVHAPLYAGPENAD